MGNLFTSRTIAPSDLCGGSLMAFVMSRNACIVFAEEFAGDGNETKTRKFICGSMRPTMLLYWITSRIINLHLKSQSKNHNLLHFNNAFIVCYFNKLYMEFTFLSTRSVFAFLPSPSPLVVGALSIRSLFLCICCHHYSYKRNSSWFRFHPLVDAAPLNDCNHTNFSSLAMKSSCKRKLWSCAIWYDVYDCSITWSMKWSGEER